MLVINLLNTYFHESKLLNVSIKSLYHDIINNNNIIYLSCFVCFVFCKNRYITSKVSLYIH